MSDILAPRHEPSEWTLAEHDAALRFLYSTLADEDVVAGIEYDHAAAVEPRSSARRQRLTDAEAARNKVIEIASHRPDGCKLDTAEAFAAAMRRLPTDQTALVAAVKNAIRRVQCRVDITSTQKLVFQRLAWACTMGLRHAFDLLDTIGFEIGMGRKATVSEAIDKLAELGLVYKHVQQRRLFAVVALLDCDLDGSLAAEITAAKRLTNAASGPAFPFIEAWKLWHASTGHVSGSTGQISSSPCPAQPCKVIDHARRQPGPEIDPLAGVTEFGTPDPSLLRIAQRPLEGGPIEKLTAAGSVLVGQATTGASLAEVSYQASEQEKSRTASWALGSSQPHDDPFGPLDETTAFSPQIARHANNFTQTLTSAEIRADFETFRLKPQATGLSFLKGIKLVDEAKRCRLRRELGSEAAVTAFSNWDRSANGNAKSSLGERIKKFLTVPPGAKFALAGKRLRDRMRQVMKRVAEGGQDANLSEAIAKQGFSFGIDRERLVFYVNRKAVSARFTPLVERIEIGDEHDRLDAIDAVVRRWQVQGRAPNKDVTEELATAAREMIAASHSGELFR